MENIILKIKNLSKAYSSEVQSIDVIRDLNLEVKQKEFLIVFGPSGSGKSTLLNLILGLEKLTTGELTFLGRRIDKTSEKELSEFRKDNIGIVYQQPYWIKSIDVVGNVAFPLSMKGIRKDTAYNKAMEALSSVGMEKWANFHPSELSSGQQQKVSLARAIITDPQIIIADEPTGNLDYNSGKRITEYLKELSEKGKTIIMVTHNLDNLDYGTRLIHIIDGRIVEDFDLTQKNIDEIKKQLISKDHIKSLVKDEIAPKSALGKNKLIDTRILEKTNPFVLIKEVILILLLSILSLIHKGIYYLLSIKILPEFIRTFRFKFTNSFNKIVNALDSKEANTINYSDLFDISIKNLFSKRKRSFIAIFGVALGIGFTVLLISLGFGLESLIISRTASINQLKHIEVFPAIGESVELNDDSINSIKDLSGVNKVLPLIGIAGKISYQESNLDIVIYGVQSEYLKNSDSLIIDGEYFKSDNLYVPEDGERSNEVVINKALLDLLELDNGIVNEDIKLGYLLENNISTTDDEEIENELTFNDFSVTGVIESEDVPVAYIPIEVLRDAESSKYSQLKVISFSQDEVGELRGKINALGFRTSSILDTIEQIESLFSSVRIIFGVIGLISLFIASLGMFNTLTVSLLERVREVGLMKVMGANSREIRRLFLSEAISMGVLGGVIGIIIGLVSAFILTLILSIISLAQGGDYISLFVLPFNTIVLIIVLSGFTGILTGFYPSRRATNIPALDALRYE